MDDAPRTSVILLERHSSPSEIPWRFTIESDSHDDMRALFYVSYLTQFHTFREPGDCFRVVESACNTAASKPRYQEKERQSKRGYDYYLGEGCAEQILDAVCSSAPRDVFICEILDLLRLLERRDEVLFRICHLASGSSDF